MYIFFFKFTIWKTFGYTHFHGNGKYCSGAGIKGGCCLTQSIVFAEWDLKKLNCLSVLYYLNVKIIYGILYSQYIITCFLLFLDFFIFSHDYVVRVKNFNRWRWIMTFRSSLSNSISTGSFVLTLCG